MYVCVRASVCVCSMCVCAGLCATAEATHTLDNVVTAAVFHAPMFALNADAEANACEPTMCGPP